MRTSILFFVLLFSPSLWATHYLVGFRSVGDLESASRYLNDQGVQIVSSLKEVRVLIIDTKDALALQSFRNFATPVFIEKQSFHKAPRAIGSGSIKKSRWSQNFIASAPPTSANLPYGLTMIGAPQAWAVTQGQGVRVLIVDTGIDSEHPALKNKIEKVYNFISTTTATQDVTDEVGHGTHVAGIIAADNLGFISGVAPQAKILIAKVCNLSGCPTDAVAQALAWGLKEKVDVINLSLGGGFTNGEKFVIDGLDSAQISVVAAAGNDGVDSIGYPAAFPSVTAVGAVDEKAQKTDYSNWGPSLAIMAPGNNILSSVPQGWGRASVFQVLRNGSPVQTISSVTFLSTPLTASLQSKDFVYAGHGDTTDFAGVDAKDKVVIVDRGMNSLMEKIKNGVAVGAKAIVILNNESVLAGGEITPPEDPITIPAVMIESLAGAALKQYLLNHIDFQISLQILPSDYSELSGTSMASPYVAGVVALMKSLKTQAGSWKIRQILAKTSTPTVSSDPLVKLPGLVNAGKAVSETLQEK